MYQFLIVDDEAIEREGVSFLIRKFSYPFRVFIQNNGKTLWIFCGKTRWISSAPT